MIPTQYFENVKKISGVQAGDAYGQRVSSLYTQTARREIRLRIALFVLRYQFIGQLDRFP